MINVALIGFDNPFSKPNEGGKRGIKARIDSLISIDNISLDVYVLTKRNEKINTEYRPREFNLYQYYMNSTSNSIFGTYPICVNKRFSNEVVSDAKNNVYDVVIYEGEQVARYRFERVFKGRKHIIYMHDIESKYRQEISKCQKNFLVKMANIVEAMRFKSIEKRIYESFDAVWFVSNDEMNIMADIDEKKVKSYYIPFPALDFVEESNNSDSKIILYVGDLSLSNNYESLKWFIKEVFNSLVKFDNDIILNVIGKISEKNKAELVKHKNINILGYVDDLRLEYSKASLLICPVIHGAGVKVKTIDSLAQHKPVVTTTKGYEGTKLVNGTHLIVEDDPRKLTEICLDIVNNPVKYKKMADEGYDFIKMNHTVANQASIICKTFKDLGIT